ncbi:STAS domain-containing protein [Glycomyces harbinensis]|uniref:Anti-sigma factor antagonist n=1 Tax=Glycomyces harbinensis TaxID=58114 RepID=A0A1G6YKZ5_9ACTN|nr:STAS domain-containing protein [Glycomyces harbinensis]SDD91058.1 anti-anti-sigma factor [Glycomyces harbinensis]
MAHQKLDISVHREANETIVVLTGEIDLHTAPRLTVAVDEALAADPVRVVLDMSGVTFCDSRGLGTLVILARAAARSRAVLVLANLGDFLKRLLAVSGIGEHFVIREPAPDPEDDAALGLSDVEEYGVDSTEAIGSERSGTEGPDQERPR